MQAPSCAFGGRRPLRGAVVLLGGDSSNTLPVYLDDGVLHVRVNLVHALQRVRWETESRFLWVDAICIDQASPRERSQQVAVMGQIYKRSECTLIWLGRGNRGDEGGLEFVKELLDLKKRFATEAKGWDGWPVVSMSVEEQRKSGIPNLRDARVRAFLSVQSNPWLTREWIIQEVVMAPKATVSLGLCTVDWDDFFNARQFASKIGVLHICLWTKHAMHHLPSAWREP
jgi:hypothetical protein